jgi:hypothetical protein
MQDASFCDSFDFILLCHVSAWSFPAAALACLAFTWSRRCPPAVRPLVGAFAAFATATFVLLFATTVATGVIDILLAAAGGPAAYSTTRIEAHKLVAIYAPIEALLGAGAGWAVGRFIEWLRSRGE